MSKLFSRQAERQQKVTADCNERSARGKKQHGNFLSSFADNLKEKAEKHLMEGVGRTDYQDMFGRSKAVYFQRQKRQPLWMRVRRAWMKYGIGGYLGPLKLIDSYYRREFVKLIFPIRPLL